MKEAFEKMTGMPDAWTNPALMVSRNAFIQGWEAALAQPAQEPWCMKVNRCTTKCEDCPDEPVQEPVAWLTKDKFSNKVDLDAKNAKETTGWSAAFPVYTAPQQRPWVGLTDENLETLILKHAPPLHPDYKDDSLHGLLQAANDFLRELNT